MAKSNIDDILKQIENRDKDFRYMGVTDFFEKMEDITLDSSSESTIVNKMITLLTQDNSSEIRGLVAEKIGLISKKVSEAHVQNISEKVNERMLTAHKNEDEYSMRDIAAIGLRNLVHGLEEKQAVVVNYVCESLTPKLVDAISKEKDEKVLGFEMDVLKAILGKYGLRLQKLDKKIQETLRPLLNIDDTRKSAIDCFASLSSTLPAESLRGLVNYFLKGLKEANKPKEKLTYVQVIVSVIRALGSYLQDVFPAIKTQCYDDEIGGDEGAYELKEACFSGFNSIVRLHPKQAESYLDDIISASTKYIGYDPAYGETGDNMDVDDEPAGEGMDDYGGDDFGDDYGDYEVDVGGYDDDESWKVRISAINTLDGIIKTKTEKLPILYEKVAPVLMSRFQSERQDLVKIAAFNTFTSLLVETKKVTEDNEAILKQIDSFISKLVKSTVDSLSSKNETARVSVMKLLGTLCQVRPGALESHISAVLPGAKAAIESNSAVLQENGLNFYSDILSTHSDAIFQDYLDDITLPVYKALSTKGKESLQVCSHLARVVPPSHLDALYTSVLAQLQSKGDREFQEAAIEASGNLLVTHGAKLKTEQVEEIAKIYTVKLDNELTRLLTIKTIDSIIHHKIDLGSSFDSIVSRLASESFVMAKSGAIQRSAFGALTSIIKKFGSHKGVAPHFNDIIKAVQVLINESYLSTVPLALDVIAAIIKNNPSSASLVKESILPNCIKLCSGQLLSGQALDSMTGLFGVIAKSKSKSISVTDLIQKLKTIASEAPDGELSKEATNSLAQCIATLIIDHDNKDSDIATILSETNSKKKNVRILSLTTLGEVGRREDLSEKKDDIFKTLITALTTHSHTLQHAASLSLGRVAIGNVEQFLPQILEAVAKHPKEKNLLLESLRELILQSLKSRSEAGRGQLLSSTKGVQNMKQFFPQLLPLLMELTESSEGDQIEIVSECLGKLARVDAAKTIAALKEKLSSKPVVRATALNALKSCIYPKKYSSLDKEIQSSLSSFLDLLTGTAKNKEDVVVQTAALDLLNTAATFKPQFVRDLIPKVLPQVLQSTKVNLDLVDIKTIGPFKKVFDDGYNMRISAFGVIYTLLETCVAHVPVLDIVNYLADGLVDHEKVLVKDSSIKIDTVGLDLCSLEITKLCHRIVSKIAEKTPATLLAGLVPLIEPLTRVVKKQVQGVEAQKAAEDRTTADALAILLNFKRSALIAIASVDKIPDARTTVPQWNEFMKTVVSTEQSMYDDILKE